MTATKTYTISRKYTCVPFNGLSGEARTRAYDSMMQTIMDVWWSVTLDFCAQDVERQFGLDIDIARTYVSVEPPMTVWTLNEITDIELLMDKLGVTDARHRAYLAEHYSVGCGTVVNFCAWMASSSYTPFGCVQKADLEYFPIDSDKDANTHGMSREEQLEMLMAVERAWHDFVYAVSAFISRYFSVEWEYVHSDDYVDVYSDDNDYIFDVETGEMFSISDAEETE